MPGGQNSELAVYLIALAVILVTVIVIAVVMLARRKRRGLTLKNSTYGNNIEGEREVPTDRGREGYANDRGEFINSQSSTSPHANTPVHHHAHNANADAGSTYHSGGSSSDFGGHHSH